VEFDNNGWPVKWKLSLSHQEVDRIGDIAFLVASGAPGPVAAVCAAASAFISVVDHIGGNNGVDIYGTGLAGFIAVWPHGISMEDAITFLGYASAGLWGLQVALIRRIAGGLFGAPRGSLRADEGHARGQEKATVIGVPGGKVAFRYHTGYLCADHARNDEAWADREGLGPWEQWTLLRNDDGTVSLRGDSGRLLCCEENEHLTVTRDNIGPWEKFTMELQGDGQYSLKAWTGRYISAAPG